MNGNVVSKNVKLYNSYSSPTVINSIGVSNNKLYLAGTRLISYNLSNLNSSTLISDPVQNYSQNSSEINYYIWSKIYVYSDTYAKAIANGINNAFNGSDHNNIQTSITKEQAYVMGFFFGDGSCGSYTCPSGKKSSWALNNASVDIIEKYLEYCKIRK